MAEILRTKADRRAARPEAGGEVGFTDLASAYDRARGARRPVRGGGPGRAGLELERRVARALASLRRMAQETAVFAGRGTGGGVGVPFATAPAVDGVDEILGIVVRSSADDPIGGVTGSLEPVGAAADARWRLDLAPERLRGASRPERERRSPRRPPIRGSGRATGFPTTSRRRRSRGTAHPSPPGASSSSTGAGLQAPPRSGGGGRPTLRSAGCQGPPVSVSLALESRECQWSHRRLRK